MAKIPETKTDLPAKDTPQAKAKAAARKAARAAAISETYATGTGEALAEVGQVMTPGQDEDLKLRELLQAVVASGEIKKSQAKPAIEAALSVIGDALAQGRDVNLPGLGKMKVKRTKETNGRRVSELRLRQNAPSEDQAIDGTERVAEDDEEG